MTTISAEEFDRIFDEGKEDILQYCDMSSVKRVNIHSQNVSIQVPINTAQKLQSQAQGLGISVEEYLSSIANEKATESPRV